MTKVFCLFDNEGNPIDWFPGPDLRPDCDRTYFHPLTGRDEGLHECIERYEKAGYKYMNLSDVLNLRNLSK